MGFVADTVENLTGLDVSNNSGSDKALRAQQEATSSANATQKYMYDTSRADTAQYRQAGNNAIQQMQDPKFQKNFTMQDFQQDPGYQFRMDQAMKALENSAAARGGRTGTQAVNNVLKTSQGLASDEFNNAYNRFNNDRQSNFNNLASIAGAGQSATNQIVNASQNYGNAVSANQLGMGNATASADMAQGSKLGNMATTFGAAALMASDERVKTNIEPISKEDLAELRKAITPYKFNYINDRFGEGDWVGVMAQDLEKTKLGRTLVVTDHDGVKKIDLNKFASVLLATLSEAA